MIIRSTMIARRNRGPSFVLAIHRAKSGGMSPLRLAFISWAIVNAIHSFCPGVRAARWAVFFSPGLIPLESPEVGRLKMPFFAPVFKCKGLRIFIPWQESVNYMSACCGVYPALLLYRSIVSGMPYLGPFSYKQPSTSRECLWRAC